MSQPRTSLRSDTFYFPHQCRRDHRAHTRGLIAGFLLVFLAALLLPSPIRAGEVEYDVINQSFEEFWASTAEDEWEVSTFEEHAEDFASLWADLPSDSYCELWTSAGYLLSISAATIAGDDTEAEFAPGVAASIYLIADLDRMSEDCLKENA